MFMVSDAEDEEAHALLTNLYMDHAAAHGVDVTDAFLDQACLAGAAKVCGDTVFLHRCLQHTKKDVDAEAAKRDIATGLQRLRNQELLPVIEQWIETSAWFPQ